MESATSSKKISMNLAAVSVPTTSANSKQRRRQEKLQKRLEDRRHSLFTKHFSNYRLPVSVASSNWNIVQLNRYEPIVDRERYPPLFVVPDQKSQWARLRMISCPCHGCSCTLDPNNLLAHYLKEHMPMLRVPFVEVPFPIEKQTLRATCQLNHLEYDAHKLLGVFGYQRIGLNPLNCPRNTLLPREYRQYSQHGVLMLFACRTRHALLWQRGQVVDVLAIWVSTPLQGVSVSLRCVAQPAHSTRYYSKQLRARSLPASMLKTPQCHEFIKTDCNVIVISYQDLCQKMSISAEQQLLNVELHVIGERKI